MKRTRDNINRRASSAFEMLEANSDDKSRLTSFGKRTIFAAFVIDTIEPVLSAIAIMLVASCSAMAQTTGGGSIFGQDQSMVPNAIRQTVIFMSGIAFLVGAGACIWGAFNYTRRQECMNQFIGGGMLMTIGGIIALISYLSGGRAVNVNRDL
jgi:hypothetical protein